MDRNINLIFIKDVLIDLDIIHNERCMARYLQLY